MLCKFVSLCAKEEEIFRFVSLDSIWGFASFLCVIFRQNKTSEDATPPENHPWRLILHNANITKFNQTVAAALISPISFSAKLSTVVWRWSHPDIMSPLFMCLTAFILQGAENQEGTWDTRGHRRHHAQKTVVKNGCGPVRSWPAASILHEGKTEMFNWEQSGEEIKYAAMFSRLPPRRIGLRAGRSRSQHVIPSASSQRGLFTWVPWASSLLITVPDPQQGPVPPRTKTGFVRSVT